MAFEEDWYELFNRTITIEPWVSEDSGGVVTYGPAVSYEVYIKDDVKVWKWENGIEKASRRTVYAHGETIGPKDRITMPAGYEPRVVHPIIIIRRDDHEGYHHHEIYT